MYNWWEKLDSSLTVYSIHEVKTPSLQFVDDEKNILRQEVAQKAPTQINLNCAEILS